MSSLISSSIGRKLFMSITGLFLAIFILVHLSLNLLLIFDDSGDLFNMAAHFMATNPMIKIMEPVLALGFIIHIIWSTIITLQNMKARPQKYNSGDGVLNAYSPTKNMFIIGGLVLIFLIIHMGHFFVPIKMGTVAATNVMQSGVSTSMHDSYTLVKGLFVGSVGFCILYIVGAILLGLHVSHGFWSAFQTIGWNNQVWRKRLEVIAQIYAWIVAIGFSIIPIYFMIKF